MVHESIGYNNSKRINDALEDEDPSLDSLRLFLSHVGLKKSKGSYTGSLYLYESYYHEYRVTNILGSHFIFVRIFDEFLTLTLF